MADTTNPITSNIQHPIGTKPEQPVEISPELQAGAPPTGGDPLAQKSRKKKKRKSWVWYYFLFMSLLTLGGLAYIDYQRTNYVLGGGPVQAFKRYRSAVKEKRWADAYEYYTQKHKGDINYNISATNEERARANEPMFVMKMKQQDETSGALFLDINIVVDATIDHYDESSDTIYLKAPLIHHPDGSLFLPDRLIEVRMVMTNEGWKINSQRPSGVNYFVPGMSRSRHFW
jgi:hypothetical protein